MKTERRTLPTTDISELPKPRPGRSGFRLALLAVLALLVVSAAAYWLTRDEADDRAAVWRKYRRAWLWRLCLSAVVGLVVCLCLSAQPLFSLLLFLIFFFSEWAFEGVYYRRFL